MILVDDRSGSKDLLDYLRPRASLERLEYGDVSIEGEGPEGVPILVGVEVKTVGDALSCLVNGRFAGHQLPGLIASYSVVYLLIEGQWRRDFKSGLLQFRGSGRRQWFDASLGTRRFMWADFDRWLVTMETKGGIRLRFTRERQETAQFLKDLDAWWSGPEGGWGKHKSHLAFDESDTLSKPQELRDRALLTPPSLVRLVARELPGVGWEKSKAGEKELKSVSERVVASWEEWERIPGIGKTMAKRIKDALLGFKS